MAPAPGGGPAACSELVGYSLNSLKPAAKILCDVIIPEPEFRYTARAQPIATALIAAVLGFLIVLTAIEINRQTELRTIEVESINSGRMLSSEAETV